MKKLSEKLNNNSFIINCNKSKAFDVNTENLCKTTLDIKIEENMKYFKCFWPKCEIKAQNNSVLDSNMNIRLNKRQFVCDFNECKKLLNINNT